MSAFCFVLYSNRMQINFNSYVIPGLSNDVRGIITEPTI